MTDSIKHDDHTCIRKGHDYQCQEGYSICRFCSRVVYVEKLGASIRKETVHNGLYQLQEGMYQL